MGGLLNPLFSAIILNEPRIFMSLISQKDREMVIEALEYYIHRLKEDNCTEASIYAYNTLLRWIELEHYKNEN
jgi:hypothetical protein